MRRLLLPILVLTLLSAIGVPAIAQARAAQPAARTQSFDPIVEVQSWERFNGAVVVAAFNGHGNYAGTFNYPGTPINGITREKALRLIGLRRLLQSYPSAVRAHLGFHFLPGKWELLKGAPNGAIDPNPAEILDIPGPLALPMETNGVFYYPSSDDFAVRLEASYIDRAKLAGGYNYLVGPDDVKGGALYIEASWGQMEWMARHADMRYTSISYMNYSWGKNVNMSVAAERFNATMAITTSTTITVTQAIGLDHAEDYPYVDWQGLRDREVIDGVLAGGVCGLVTPALNPYLRLGYSQGLIEEFDSQNHTEGYQYYPTGADPWLWHQTVPNGRYVVLDNTTEWPAPLIVVKTRKPITLRVTTLINRDHRTLFVSEARVGK